MNIKNRLDVTKAFFVIDSDHLQEVTSKLYGFMLHENKLITDEAFRTDEMSTGGVRLFA